MAAASRAAAVGGVRIRARRTMANASVAAGRMPPIQRFVLIHETCRSFNVPSARACELREGRADLPQARRLVENAIDVRRHLVLRREPLTPPGEEDHGRIR